MVFAREPRLLVPFVLFLALAVPGCDDDPVPEPTCTGPDCLDGGDVDGGLDTDAGPDASDPDASAGCGDGVLDAEEECDDGNTEPDDGCSPVCIVEEYGEGCTSDFQCEGGQICVALSCVNPDQVRETDFDRVIVGESDADDDFKNYHLGTVCERGAWSREYAAWPQTLVWLVVFVELDGGDPVMDDDEIYGDVAHINSMYERANIEFRIKEIRTFEEGQTITPSNQYISLAYFDDLGGKCGEASITDWRYTGMISASVQVGCHGPPPAVETSLDTWNTSVHELGHALSLHHPHGGDMDDVEPVSGDCYENPTDLGDSFCDTAPDPGTDHCSSFAAVGVCDVECAAYGDHDPSASLVMSYYADFCQSPQSAFSDEQINTMHCVIREYLPGTVVHSATPIEDDPTCDDEVHNGLEIGIDCGGPDCPPCESPCDAVEVCDGEDNDCDGVFDEDVDRFGEAVENRCPRRGLCLTEAQTVCRNGEWTCDLPDSFVEEECVPDGTCVHGSLDDPTCTDDVDNDCDGAIDENNPVLVCAEDRRFDQIGGVCFFSDFGMCGREGGTYRCVQLGEGCGVGMDCIGARAPEAEQCDFLNHNCDDNEFTHDRNDIDGDGYGDCPGLADCLEADPTDEDLPADVLRRARNTNPGAYEICGDGLDNDCDGREDEGLLNDCGRCGSTPVESCNGIDDDCDGTTDEDCPRTVRMTIERVQALDGDGTCGGVEIYARTLRIGSRTSSGSTRSGSDFRPDWSVETSVAWGIEYVDANVVLYEDDSASTCGGDDHMDIHPSSSEMDATFRIFLDTDEVWIFQGGAPHRWWTAVGTPAATQGDGDSDDRARVTIRFDVD